MSATLAARVTSGRPDDHLLLRAPGARLDTARARALGPVKGLDPAATVLVSVADPVTLVETLLALDGHVAGLLLVSAEAAPEVVAALAGSAGATLIVTDRDDLPAAPPGPVALRRPAELLGRAPAPGRGDAAPETSTETAPRTAAGPNAATAPRTAAGHVTGPATGAPADTAWLVTTSGTTGLPKIVPHDLASLARTVRRDPFGQATVWGLVYEMTRFAGLQVALQSLIGGGTLAAAPRRAPMAEQIAFLAEAGTTHLSATPTLWRRLLMDPGIAALPLRQATMGGEIADQAVLDAVGARFPRARVTHIYASTEAGVGFAVNDRRAGFPLAYAEDAPGGIGVKVARGLLWLKPPGARVVRYLGGEALETDAGGYVNTGDRIEIAGDRAHFLGRDSGVVNVGGVKVHPERVERLIAAVPGVGLAAVSARKSPITGALLMAAVVPADPAADRDALRDRILAACRGGLEREAVPARIRFVDHLETNAAGKIARL